MKVSPQFALDQLAGQPSEFLELFQHGTLRLEVYKPDKVDRQQPHSRDEVYVIIAGTGKFFNDEETVPFAPGDFLFVKAGKEHHFFDFSADFSTWVIFYGPEGGEK